MAIEVGVNMEFVRSDNKSFAWGVEKAAEIGYKYIEPMVHWGRELLSEAGYFHSVSMLDDPLEIKEIMDKHGVKASSLSSHCPLMKPEISVEYLKQAIRWAADLGTDICNTDEGVKPGWMDEETAFQVMRYTMRTVAPVAERHGIRIGIETHQIYTRYTEKLIKIADLAESPNVGFNPDMGNTYLGGVSDPYELLETVAPRTIHVHAKDISVEQGEDERGKVTGTAVGCACGEGVIDWAKTVRILKKAGFHGVLSVECETVEQAEKSLKHLTDVIKKEGAD